MEEPFNHSLNTLQLQALNWGTIDSSVELFRRVSTNYHHTYLFVAVTLISLILHFAVFRWVQIQVPSGLDQPQSPLSAQHKILIQLKKTQQVPSKLEAVAPDQHTKSQISNFSPSDSRKISNRVQAKSGVDPARPKAFPPNETVRVKSIHPPQVSDEPQIISSDNSRAPFSGVFNPTLRAKLQSQPSHTGVKSDELSWKTADNSVLIQVGDDHCLRSSTASNGNQRGTNWYHTNCGGKSESEQFMDRVNAQLRGK